MNLKTILEKFEESVKRVTPFTGRNIITGEAFDPASITTLGDFDSFSLLSVGTIFFVPDLQSVHGGENEYEPICYRHSY